ncbi:uncharacterized protein LACBIDRAFT_331828 [Laccaria bicolor S238N-H82]|uniref:Predicted protein n=1 Tax=Laccaria bicolor (strain S238N-H82 / ATCC MYA-4686) TaxID=486041 RepID=B0DQP8_LACBS|nr:uncharacterized protein LACBIDRAFT_331828 [Laccaria bicolor S238N-H82]EDR03152.1 predicted protein [Laccaria bicolor S238N-H82]|eukprot:XP_001886293.1 predicted protein [Laccaria bicolor S238N-H82]
MSEAASIITSTFQHFNFAIPDLGRSPGAWKRVIKQWEEVDPVTKHALKDWPGEWYKGSSAMAGKRMQRKMIFDKYVRLCQDEGVFLSRYPDANKSIPKLLEAIRWNNGRTCSSKHGTAKECKSKSPLSSLPETEIETEI